MYYFYTGMGISAYLVIDSVTSRGEPHEQIDLHLWRIIKGRVRKTEPDAEGYLQIPAIKLKVKAQAKAMLEKDGVSLREVIRSGVHQQPNMAARDNWARAVAELMYERGRHDMQKEILAVLK